MMRDPFSKTLMYSEEVIGLNSLGGSRYKSVGFSGSIGEYVSIFSVVV